MFTLMITRPLFLLISLLSLLAAGCGSAARNASSLAPEGADQGVRVEATADGDRLLVRGKPFYVRGACILSASTLPAFAAAGGNTVRTYPGIDLDSVFHLADSLGLMVIPGLDVTPRRHGLDYRDTAQVSAMKRRVKAQVLRYRDHPSLLMWGLGNEVHLLASNQEDDIFGVINDLSRMVHRLDSRHPTTTMTNGPTGAWKVWQACDDLDVISVNVFQGIDELKSLLKWGGGAIDQPILISEWAPSGYWNASTTTWGAPIEMNAEEKAFSYTRHYQQYLSEESGNLLGSCLFLWGQKQEHTHTWFSVFTEQGEATVLTDEIARLWTGQYPANRAPLAQAIQVGSYEIKEEVYLHPGQEYIATGYALDADGDSLTYHWEITREFERGFITGGDVEQRPAPMTALCLEKAGDRFTFRAPDEIGAYRIYFYARDPHGKAGVMNLPFFVLKKPGLE